ncbi:hypothetical protein H7849_21505 [Alloacidobacterium dinghuense]|uniref:Uncharacterized protein n=1 Tax=Alloacidobacterium dinghuense TaxID=2763107 RepID=A0A7G8BGE3_9BACT|nr:hypothetical protein [Alloacidobacterium dinghuense]QNI31613.1 hypothetical protein H7849_21505 [Alloacidobacterium dinghuense]
MSADLSVRNPNSSALLMADALLRAGGGIAVSLFVAPATVDSSDAGQVGIDIPNFQQLSLSPAIFRRVRATMQEGQQARYELLISASAVQQQVSTLQLTSADALFDTAAGIEINGAQFLVESRSVSQSLGQVYLYRLLLRESHSLLQPVP